MKAAAQKPVRTLESLVQQGKITQSTPGKEPNPRMPKFPEARAHSGLLSDTQTGDTTTSPANEHDISSGNDSTQVIHKIPLEKLRPSLYNSRKHRPESRVDEIIATLSKDGQREPITVYRGEGDDKGYYMILSGVTRLMAAKSLGWKTLDARIDESCKPGDVLAVLKASHLHNDTSPETDLDHATVIEELSDKGHKIADIALALGYKSDRIIYRLKLFKKLPTAVYDLACANPHKFHARFAEALSAATEELGEETVVALAHEALKEDYGVPKLQRKIEIEKKKKKRDSGNSVRSRKEINIPIHLGNARVGHYCVMTIPDSSNKKVQVLAELPEDLAEFFAERVETLANELKKMGSGQ
jgi:ParB/RepB/Spo0J family partition protein